MIRRYGEAVKQGQTYRFRPGVYAILPQGGDLLLTYQADPHYEVQLPGGGIDPGVPRSGAGAGAFGADLRAGRVTKRETVATAIATVCT